MLLLINPIYGVNIRTIPAVSKSFRGSRCEVFMNMPWTWRFWVVHVYTF